jgi:hypothetical protein
MIPRLRLGMTVPTVFKKLVIPSAARNLFLLRLNLTFLGILRRCEVIL